MDIDFCGLDGGVSQPECDHGSIHPRLQQLHRSGVPEDMGGKTLLSKGRAMTTGLFGVLPNEAFDGIATESPATTAGKEYVRILAALLAHPLAQHGNGLRCQRRTAFLAAFSETAYMSTGSEMYILTAQLRQFRDSQCGLHSEQQQGVIATTDPTLTVGLGEKNSDLIERQECDESAVEAFMRDGQDALNLITVLDLAQRGKAEEGVDGAQAGVPGADAIASLLFQVFEKSTDQRRIEIQEVEFGRDFPPLLLDEVQQ